MLCLLINYHFIIRNYSELFNFLYTMSDFEEIPFLKRNRKSFKYGFKEESIKERILFLLSRFQFWKKPVDDLPNRVIKLGEINPLYRMNEIHTCKYNFISFFPLNLMEQFSKLPNFYFLVSFHYFI